MTTKIPATVSVLTRNSGASLARALESVRDFEEILVCDGGSTDTTLEIARTFGARVIPQNKLFQDADGRLNDWSGVRNECLELGTYPWHFYLDSDECIDPKLIEEIRTIIEKDVPAAYWVPRKYILNGIVIERSISYPNKQMRFFNRDAVVEFRKPVHERIIVKDGYPVRALKNPMFVPVEDDYATARTKTERYLDQEIARHKPLTWRIRRAMIGNAARAVFRTCIRLVEIAFEAGPRMPLYRDLLAPRYEIELALRALVS